MRRKLNKVTPTRSKIVYLTGGLKDDVSQLELKGGDLVGCENYQEIDGLFHGYASVSGYERFDGQELASKTPLHIIKDKGTNTSTILSLNYTGDISNQGHVISSGATSPVIYAQPGKFLESELYFTSSVYLDYQHTSILNIGAGDFTIDFLLRLTDASQDDTIFSKFGAYQLRMDSNKITFEYSSDGSTYGHSFEVSHILANNKQYHVTLIKRSNVLYALIDGVIDSNTFTVSTPFYNSSTADLRIRGFVGFLDEFRFSDEYMWYQDFEIPTKSYSDSLYYTEEIDDTAREAQRALIQPVPGVGPILGISIRKGIVGVARDAINPIDPGLDPISTDIYRADPTGWFGPIPSVPMLHVINGKDTASTPVGFVVGDDLLGSVSGATADVLYINAYSGDWASPGTVHAQIILKNVVGGPFVDTDILSSVINTTTTGDVEAGTVRDFRLEPGGNYEFIDAAFALVPDVQREIQPYFVNGVNEPAYYDNNLIIPIAHDNLPSTQGIHPTHIIKFKDRLILGYPDGQVWYSEVEDPVGWDTSLGAGAFELGDEITGFIVAPGDVLVVFCKNSIHLIKGINELDAGKAVADYAFFREEFSKRSGAIPNTLARLLGQVYFLDDRGLTTLTDTDTYGDFAANSISKNVQRRLISKRDGVVASSLQREFNQYRLFFDDKTALVWTFDADKKVKGITQLRYKHQMTCFKEGEQSNGDLIMLFGDDGGYVHWMDSGTSFDGQEIETLMTTSYHSYSTSTYWKRFRKVTLEAQADKGVRFYAKPDFNYRDPNIPRSVQVYYDSIGSGGVWGEDIWGQFQWGDGTESPVLYLMGYGNNMSVTFTTSNKYTNPHVINSMVVEYSKHARKM